MSLIPAQPGFWVHELYFSPRCDMSASPLLSGEMENRECDDAPQHDRHPVIAWGYVKGERIPIAGGAVDDVWIEQPKYYWAIERPDGTFNARTGYVYPDFKSWLAAAILAEEEFRRASK